MSISLGTRHSFEHTFLNGSGVETNPSSVKFYLREHVDGTELEWTFNASPVEGTHYPTGMQPIVKSGTSTYSVAYDARKPERVTGTFVSSGTVYEGVQLTLFVRHAEIESLDAPRS